MALANAGCIDRLRALLSQTDNETTQCKVLLALNNLVLNEYVITHCAVRRPSIEPVVSQVYRFTESCSDRDSTVPCSSVDIPRTTLRPQSPGEFIRARVSARGVHEGDL